MKQCVMEKKRYFGLDAVRVLALCLLLWLHFLLRNGFYSKPVNNVPMILATAGRVIFMCCIPLFLMLTGYLKCQKPWNGSYYRSLLPILISWVLISPICMCYKIFVSEVEMTAYEWVVEFFNFKMANYSWYIEMYIGLILVSPFLNIAWTQMKTKKKHQAMVLSFMLLTFLPSAVNGIAWDGETKLNVIPNYWSSLYFFTYYLIGCYIRTWQPRVKKRLAIPAAILIALMFALINCVTGGAQKNFYSGYNISYGHPGTAAIAVLLFLSVYQLRCRNRFISGTMAAVSNVALEMYLISCVFDQTIYRYQKGYGAEEYLWRGILACGLVFLLSFLSGWAIHWLSTHLSTGLTNCVKTMKSYTICREKQNNNGNE